MCEKHYRFAQMRSRSKRDGKLVPSYEWLDAHTPKDMICPTCKRKMNWRQKDGASTVITIQHDRDGELNLICLSCNTRHAQMDDDSFYEFPIDHKLCPRCKVIKPFDSFCTDNGGRWKNKKSTCRECSNKYHAEWVERNRGKYNETRRKYYHERKNSGNPIPR